MFGLFKKSVNVVEAVNKMSVKPTPVKEPELSSDDEQEEVDDTPEVTAEPVDIQVESGGGKGWPTDVNTVFYHRQQGLICVGTESGAIYVYGDGFQFMRPHTKEEGIIAKYFAALDPDLLLVAYTDNSVDVLELPSMSLVGDLPGSWIGSRNGDITAVFVDEPGEKNYVYVGSSEGVLQVLDATDSTLRVSDFTLTWKTMGLSAAMAISDIKLCPKDEKYLAVAFEGPLTDQGAVVIFDLSKMKPHRVYETKAMLCMTWNHVGEVLYGGAKDGTLFTMGIDKVHASSPWNARVELVDEDEVGDVTEEPVSIRRLIWMAPQPPSVEGCLFALLGCPGPDNDPLKTVVTGLSPIGAHGDLETVFALPGIPSEKVLDCALVPTYLKSQAELVLMQVDENDEGDDDDSATPKTVDNALRATITPAVLVLTKRSYSDDDDGEGEAATRQLKVVRCPQADMANWAFEVGSLAEPRLAREVLPGASSVTYVTGITAENSVLSLSSVLAKKGAESAGVIAAAQRAGNGYSGPSSRVPAPNSTSAPSTRGSKPGNSSRRLSTRDFFDLQQLDAAEENAWEMVLAVGEHPDNTSQRNTRTQDIVVKGYENGTVVAWGVSLPETRGNIWLPLMSMRCGRSEVTCISHDESAGLLVAGDEQGVLVIWEVYEDSSNIGAAEVLKQVHSQAMAVATAKVEESAAKAKTGPGYSAHGARGEVEDGSDDDEGESERPSFHGHGSGQEYSLYNMYNFNGVREVLRTKLHNHITATLLIPQFTSIVVGTEDGTVYICTQYNSVLFSEIENLDRHGATGSVIGLSFGTFLLSERYNVPAIYVAFSSGNVAVVQLSTLQMIAYSPSLDRKHVAMLAESPRSNVNHDLCLTDGKYVPVRKPALKDMVQVFAEEAFTAAQSRASTPGPDAVIDDKSPLRDINAGLRMGMKGFVQMKEKIDKTALTVKEKIDKTAKETAQALKIPLPPSGETVPTTEAVVKRKRIPFRDVSRYLVLLVGRVLITFDLHRFHRVATKASLTGYNGNALSVKVIAQRPMILSKFLTYVRSGTSDAESDDDEGGMLCAAAVNANGLMVMISVREKSLINHTQLVHEAEDESQLLEFGTILPNGNCYLVRAGGEMVHTATITLLSAHLQLAYPLPERASPGASAPKDALMLLHGREALISARRNAARKRRTSMIKLTSTPFDISKVFSKTREQRQKDQLLGANNNAGGSDSEDAPRVGSAAARTTTTKASSTMSGLNETREAFQQRGEKLSRAAVKADDMKDSASSFSKAAKEQKEQLKKKSTFFGLF